MSAFEAGDLCWAVLLHLGFNMWAETDAYDQTNPNRYIYASDTLRFDEPLWDEAVARMAAGGLNTLLIDVGEGMRFASHPELAVRGSLTHAQMRALLARARAQGITCIPKLNFSATHDVWLGEYAHMLCTDTYRSVCAELIAEIIEVFDRPAYVHIGMDEEMVSYQRGYSYICERQGDLWWRDFYNLLDACRRGGAAAWVWADMIWNKPDEYIANMPKDVLQSNWYYNEAFDGVQGEAQNYVRAYELLDKAGYRQVPTGSNWAHPRNMYNTVQALSPRLDRQRLAGFMQTIWYPTVQPERERVLQGINQLCEAKRAFYP